MASQLKDDKKGPLCKLNLGDVLSKVTTNLHCHR